ncbi:hypothetical protein EZV62_007535 [Acer yangbiense]|uniref:Pentatricopeptide repeat-containing protein n=1 Tax=Acer yangbiense TaxID=1000413 RepID=A0A5C7IAA7_9ROSI|nr:hypothetical protein EZV62_007535 [Acer yangbiense]
MPCRNVVSWTGIIDGYTRMNRFGEALALFRRMVVCDFMQPCEVTILAILPAVWQTGDVKNCQLIHGYGEKKGFNATDIRVSNCLIDTYAKCGCIRSASRFFEKISVERRNLVSWTSIITGFAMHGMGKEAIENFERMERVGLKPNRVTYLSVLNACSHGGLVEEGFKFFYKMVKEGQVLPDIKHYGCLVDMLGRAGRLEEAEKIALEVPSEITNDVIWRTLLGACSFHGNVEMGERATRKILEMERGYGGDYVLMSNILTGVGRFGDAERLRKEMDERNALKCSRVLPIAGHDHFKQAARVPGSMKSSVVLKNTILSLKEVNGMVMEMYHFHSSRVADHLEKFLLQIRYNFAHSEFLSPPYLDSFTYSFLTKTCVSLGYPNLGRYVSLGFSVAGTKVFDEMPKRNSVTWNVVVTGFVKWGELEFARSLFEKMPCRNVVSWTGIIDGYTRMNQSEAIENFVRMERVGRKRVLNACSHGAVEDELRRGSSFFIKWSRRVKFCRTYGCLVDMLGRAGRLEEAEKIALEVPSEITNDVIWRTQGRWAKVQQGRYWRWKEDMEGTMCLCLTSSGMLRG